MCSDCDRKPYEKVILTSNDAGEVALCRKTVFPPHAVQELALCIGRSVDCYVPTSECEAAVVEFVLALERCGWALYRPAHEPG